MTEKLKEITSRTVFGFTLKEIGTSITLLFAIFLFWMNINVRVLAIETSNVQLQKEIVEVKKEIQDNKNERIKQIEDLRKENREDHILLKEGQDKIMDYLIKHK